jgi:hypothetical protein
MSGTSADFIINTFRIWVLRGAFRVYDDDDD